MHGCDGSVLLDDTVMLQGEKTASPNVNSLTGYEILDRIKNKIESDWPGIVSCVDILTVAVRDAVILVDGPYWDVPLGRKDSRTASYNLANSNIPTANEGLTGIISKFIYQGLSVTDTVTLSGLHAIGMAQCKNHWARIYGDYPSPSAGFSDPTVESQINNLTSGCLAASGGDNNVSPMDYATPDTFDNSYFRILINGEGLLNSDQELYTSIFAVQTRSVAKNYAEDLAMFFEQFAKSMVKMGNITNSDSFVNEEVRKNCRFINT